MSFATFLTLRNSNLTQFTAQTIQGSTIKTISTAAASTFTASTITSNTLSLSSITVSSINGAIPGTGSGTSVFSTLNVSSLNAVSTVTASSINVTTGSVGIGTSSPASVLQINTPLTASGLFPGPTLTFGTNNATPTYWQLGLIQGYVAANSGGGTNGFPGGLAFFTKNPDYSSSSTPTVKMVLDSNGNMGIGTTTPSQLLHVYGDGARIRIDSTTANNSVLELKTKTNTSYLFTDQSGHLEIYPNTTSLNVLLQPGGGNVGIGTNNPATTLQLYNSGNPKIFLNGGVYTGFVSLAVASAALDFGFDTTTISGSTTGGVIRFFPNGSESVRIANNGFVGIGTNNPGYTLDVNGTARATNIINTNAGYYFGYASANPTVYQSNGTNNTSGTIYANVYNYILFPSVTQSPASFITTSGAKYYVPYNGIYTICFTSATSGTNTNLLELFISKNQYNNSSDLNSPGNTLACSIHPASTAQSNISWSGYLTTSDFFCVGFYTGVGGTGTMGNRSSLAVTLVQRMG
jgi:hypothetical protein